MSLEKVFFKTHPSDRSVIGSSVGDCISLKILIYCTIDRCSFIKLFRYMNA